MHDNYLRNLCSWEKWWEVREFLFSDASSKDKKRQQIFHCREEQVNDDGDGFSTCLHYACKYGAPEGIIDSMIDIGGKELVMMHDVLYDDCGQSISGKGGTALHCACSSYEHDGSASFDVIELLIDVGGKELVMTKDGNGYTALHELCDSIIYTQNNAARIIKFMREVAGTGTILTKKNNKGQTPLDIVTNDKYSDEIKALLQPRIKNDPSNARNDSSNLVPADDRVNNTTCTCTAITAITRTLQDQLKAANQKVADLNNTIETQNVFLSEHKTQAGS